jgi:hypothetical protein
LFQGWIFDAKEATDAKEVNIRGREDLPFLALTLCEPSLPFAYFASEIRPFDLGTALHKALDRTTSASAESLGPTRHASLLQHHSSLFQLRDDFGV